MRLVLLAVVALDFAMTRPAGAQCPANGSSCITCHETHGARPVLQGGQRWHADHGFGDLLPPSGQRLSGSPMMKTTIVAALGLLPLGACLDQDLTESADQDLTLDDNGLVLPSGYCIVRLEEISWIRLPFEDCTDGGVNGVVATSPD